jgi:eukaryotic-like serine/threonine-protein kinase
MGTLGGIPLDVGDVLAKKYRLERLVGEGGTGVVVAARHLQLERLVAIKFLRTALASDEIRLRFEREARAIGQIESEHVVLVLDVGTLDDGHSPYMVMEFLEGRDLARTLREDGPLTVFDAVDCIMQVCEVLEGAHAQGIIHRDLKPANLFLTRREDGGPHVKVVDFGISKILDPKILASGPTEVTSAFSILGSPRYMAPEQLRNSKDVDGRADLWSLGTVLFQLLTGRRAFDAENNVHASLAVLTEEPPLVRSLAPHVPAALEAVVNKCLTKDRDGRFASAAELADALRPFASDHARESLERLHAAKQEPSVTIALGVTSEGARVDTHQADALSAGLTPPIHPASSARPPLSSPPSSGDPSAAFSRPVRRASGLSLKLAIAGGGLLAVLVAFGVLTLLKLAAQSIGVLETVNDDDAASSAPPSSRLASGTQLPEGLAPPSQAVTVTLDAGRAPP